MSEETLQLGLFGDSSTSYPITSTQSDFGGKVLDFPQQSGVMSDSVLSALIEKDPSFKIFESSAVWQSDYSTTGTLFAGSPMQDKFKPDSDGKGAPKSWRKLQAECWHLYRTFGPINSSVGTKADYTVGAGFGVSSANLQINQIVRELDYSHRNKLYSAMGGWHVRMQAEGELFLLVSFDDDGYAKLRVLEPSKIGQGDTDTGLLVNPSDITETIFYSYHGASGNELIPDIRVAYDETKELLKIAKTIDTFSEKLTEGSKATGKFTKCGGFSRFIIHWKNLTGINEYSRDTSVLVTVLEAVNLYWNAIKWQLDHKKAQCSYTNTITFEASVQGRIAFTIYTNASKAEKDKLGWHKPLTPGSTLVLPPGVKFDVKSPQISKISGENQDLLNIAGAGARSPQDMFQGQSSGATHSSLKASRSPLEIDAQNHQHRMGNFFKYEVLRAVFFVGSIFSLVDPIYKKRAIESVEKGVPKIIDIDVEGIELVDLSFPKITFEENIDSKANAYMGSQHIGVRGMGVSDKKVAKDLGIADLEKERRETFLEEEKYGPRELETRADGSNLPSKGDAKDEESSNDKAPKEDKDV